RRRSRRTVRFRAPAEMTNGRKRGFAGKAVLRREPPPPGGHLRPGQSPAGDGARSWPGWRWRVPVDREEKAGAHGPGGEGGGPRPRDPPPDQAPPRYAATTRWSPRSSAADPPSTHSPFSIT